SDKGLPHAVLSSAALQRQPHARPRTFTAQAVRSRRAQHEKVRTDPSSGGIGTDLFVLATFVLFDKEKTRRERQDVASPRLSLVSASAGRLRGGFGSLGAPPPRANARSRERRRRPASPRRARPRRRPPATGRDGRARSRARALPLRRRRGGTRPLQSSPRP